MPEALSQVRPSPANPHKREDEHQNQHGCGADHDPFPGLLLNLLLVESQHVFPVPGTKKPSERGFGVPLPRAHSRTMKR